MKLSRGRVSKLLKQKAHTRKNRKTKSKSKKRRHAKTFRNNVKDRVLHKVSIRKRRRHGKSMRGGVFGLKDRGITTGIKARVNKLRGKDTPSDAEDNTSSETPSDKSIDEEIEEDVAKKEAAPADEAASADDKSIDEEIEEAANPEQ